MQATVFGSGYAYATPPIGYVSCLANLTLEIEDTLGGFWIAQTSIYNQTGTALWNLTSFDGQTFSVILTLPAIANHVYDIWALAEQYVFVAGAAAATSNFNMVMGPVWICSCGE